MLWVGAIALLMALPLPSAGLPTAHASAPHATPSLVRPTAAPLVAPGAPATTSAQAIAAAQASLAKAWGGAPTATSSPCASALRACDVHLSADPLHPSAPSPSSKKAQYPPATTGASVAYDPAPSSGYSYVAMFGGLQSNGLPSAQTWIYESGYWENITPNASVKKLQPIARWDAMMAYDANPQDQFIVMFGGCVSRAYEGLCVQSIDDTWELANGAWARVQPSSPPSGRWDGAMTYDPALSSVVLFGGATGLDDTLPPPGACTTLSPALDSDTWEFSAASGTPTWTQIATSGTSPPSGYGGRMAYDPSDDAAILFGGSSFYRLDHLCSEPDELAQTFEGSTDSGTWALSGVGTWSSLSGVAPPDRADANMASEANGAIILEGGANSSGTVFSDVWMFANEAGGWRELSISLPIGGPLNATPVARYDSGFAWDGYGPDSYFFLLGGTDTAGTVVGDAWSFTPPTTWTLESPELSAPTAPSSRYQEAMAWDDAVGAVVLFGGETCGASSCSFLGDTWLYSGGLWQRLATSNAPSPRFGAALDYNPWSGILLLFGGCGVVCPLGDTWQFARPSPLATPVWRELFGSAAPPARYYASLAFDPYDQVSVLFGGCEGAKGPCPADDTWVYNASIGGWKFVASASGANAPPARFGAAMAALNRSNVSAAGSFNGTLLFGGEGVYGMLGDTWNFSFWGTGTHRQARWTELVPEISPSPRIFGTLVFDPIDTSLILLGGCEPSACPAIDPWVFSLQSPPPPANTSGPPPPPTGGGPPPPPPPPTSTPMWPWNYTNLTTLSSPGASGPGIPPSAPGPARYGMVAVWDPIDGPAGYVLVVGGRTFSGSTLPESDSIAGYLWSDLADYG